MIGRRGGRGATEPAAAAPLAVAFENPMAALAARVRSMTAVGLPALRTGGFFRRWTVDRAEAVVHGSEQSDLTGAEVALLALGYHYGLAVGLLSQAEGVPPAEVAERAWTAAVAAFRNDLPGQQAA